MMPVVSLEGVSKKYRILPSQRDRLKSTLTFGKSKAGRDFWALENANLEVEPGTALGVLGRNGAGKSTLLKLISGVVQPTSGTVRVNGRLMALFQLGAGFEEEFTGRENIMMNGLILGIERKEMLERLDAIEAFAEIGEFMDQPLKTYSSGMQARLGFAVAVSVEPDILLVDETLSVGDAVFRAKGIQKMRDLRDSGATILFVSHSADQVREFCTEAILLHKGSLVSRGDTNEVLDQYQALTSNAAAQRNARLGLDQPPAYETTQDGENKLETPDFEKNSALGNRSLSLHHGTGDARIQNVELLDEHGRPVNMVAPDSNLTVRVHAQYTKTVNNSVIGILLRNEVGLEIFSTNTVLEKASVGRRRASERVIVDFTFQVPLKNGHYNVTAAVSDLESENSHLNWADVTAVFEVPRPSDEDASAGLVHLPTQVKVFEPYEVLKHKPLR